MSEGKPGSSDEVTVLEPAERSTVVRRPIHGDLASLRRVVREFIAPLGLPERRRLDFVLAVNEALGNVLDHARADGTLTLRHHGADLVAEIHDTAGRLTDPDAGRTPPPVGARRGYGLWLMRQVCDEVEIVHDDTGSAVRLRMRLPRPPT